MNATLRRLLRWALTGLVAGVLLPAARAQAGPALKDQPTGGISAGQAFDAAVKLYEDNKCAEALVAFQNFQKDFQFSTYTPHAIYYEGWCLGCLERHQDAAKAFEKFLKTFPDHAIAPEATLKQAESYGKLKDFMKAAGLYHGFQEKYSKPKPHDLMPQAMLGEAWMYYRQGLQDREKKDNDAATKNFDTAKQITRKVSVQYAGDAQAKLDALFLLAQILTDQKNYAEARAIYKEMASQRANYRQNRAMFMAGETMWGAKNYADAIEYYSQVLPKAIVLAKLTAEIEQLRGQIGRIIGAGGSPALVQSRIASLRTLLEQTSTEPDLRASAVFRIANCFDALELPQEAAVVYRHFLRVYPPEKLGEREKNLFEQAWYKLIEMLNKCGRFQEAEVENKAFRAKQGEKGSDLLTAVDLADAEAKYKTERYEEAQVAYDRVIKTSKDAPVIEWAEFQIGACQFGLKKYDKCLEATAAFVKKYPESKYLPLALFRTGLAQYAVADAASTANQVDVARTNLTAAIDNFEQIRQKYPTTEILPDVTFKLGYLYGYRGVYDTNDYSKAVGAFTDFVTKWKANPLVPEALYQTASNYRALNQFELAVETFQGLVDRFPDHDLAPGAAIEIAYTWGNAKNPDNMVAAFHAFVEKYPKNPRVPEAMFAAGYVLETEKKSFDAAITEYRNVIAKITQGGEPTEETLRPAVAAELRIVGILEQLNKIPEAVADCKQFLASFSGNATVAREMITRIPSLCTKGKIIDTAYQELEGLAKQYQQNNTIRIMATSSACDLALDQEDNKRAYGYALQLLADPEKDKLPAGSYLAIGNALVRTDHPDQARDVLKKLIEKFPDDARVAPLAKLSLGEAYLALKSYDDAERSIQEMLAAADPKANPPPDLAVMQAVPAGKEALAETLEAKGKDADALVMYNDVIRIGKGKIAAKASFRAAMLYMRKKETNPNIEKDNKKAALAYFMRVGLLTGGDIGEEAAYRVGECHEALANCEAARNAYSGYLRRFPNGRFIKEATEKLKTVICAPKPQP